MNTTTALSPAYLDKAVELVLPRPRRTTLRRTPTSRLLQRFAQLMGVIAIAPVALAAVSVALLMLIAKLLFALIAVAFER